MDRSDIFVCTWVEARVEARVVESCGVGDCLQFRVLSHGEAWAEDAEENCLQSGVRLGSCFVNRVEHLQ